MPILRNRLRFSRVWQRRERAIRCCVTVIISAVRSKNVSCILPVNHKDRTRAEDAMRIWQTVISGFFPQPPLMYFSQKQMAYSSDYHMATERFIVTNLEMTQSKFAFFILKTPLHMPAGKADMEQRFQRSTIGGIRDKIFDLFGVFDIASDNQPMHPSRQAIALEIKLGGLGFPNHGAFCSIFDVKLFPRNFSQHRRVKQQLFHTTGRRALGFKPGEMAFSTHSVVMMLFAQKRRFYQPAGK